MNKNKNIKMFPLFLILNQDVDKSEVTQYRNMLDFAIKLHEEDRNKFKADTVSFAQLIYPEFEQDILSYDYLTWNK